jgi:hypothetical protein
MVLVVQQIRNYIMTTVNDARLAQFTRFNHDIEERVLKGSLSPEDITLLLSHLNSGGERAQNLLAYAKANCPDTIKLLDPASFFTKRPGLMTCNKNFIERFDHTKYPEDSRPLKLILETPKSLTDIGIARLFGGKDGLKSKAASLTQIMRGIDTFAFTEEHSVLYSVQPCGILSFVTVVRVFNEYDVEWGNISGRAQWPKGTKIFGN